MTTNLLSKLEEQQEVQKKSIKDPTNNVRLKLP
jgi:hypothetical protein